MPTSWHWPVFLKTDHLGQPLPIWLRVALGIFLLYLLDQVMTSVGDVTSGNRDVGLAVLKGLLVVATGIALLRRRRVAVELFCWMALIGTLNGGDFSVGNFYSLLSVGMVAAFLFSLLLLRRRKFFTPAIPWSRWRELLAALRATVALFVILEIAAGVVIRQSYSQLFLGRAPPFRPPPSFQPGRPTFATLGSSPATFERVSNLPFSALLEKKLGDRFNFLYQLLGGVNSDMLVQMAGRLIASDRRPDAFLLYAGHQDLNQASGLKMLRELDLMAHTSIGQAAVKQLVRRSCLVRLLLYLMRRAQYESIKLDEDVLGHYQLNIRRIVELAAGSGMQVFVITLVVDRSRSSEDVHRYVDRVNDFLRALPQKHTNVSLVDFDKVLYQRYPNGRREGCRPFEPVPGSEVCGDPFHLGPEGHLLLADTLSPVLLDWERAR